MMVRRNLRGRKVTQSRLAISQIWFEVMNNVKLVVCALMQRLRGGQTER